MNTTATGAGPVDNTRSQVSRLCTLPLRAAAITGGFWAERQEVNRSRSLAHGLTSAALALGASRRETGIGAN